MFHDYSLCDSECVCVCVCARGVKREAEAGVIDRIQLNNFMCHRKLDVSLSANTNFILGRNGSENLSTHTQHAHPTHTQCIYCTYNTPHTHCSVQVERVPL